MENLVFLSFPLGSIWGLLEKYFSFVCKKYFSGREKNKLSEFMAFFTEWQVWIYSIRLNPKRGFYSIPSPSRKMMVVAPMVMMSPSEMRIRSLGPKISFIRKVPVLLNPSRRV